MNYIKRAEELIKSDNYRKSTNYIGNIKIDTYTYILSDYDDFKTNNSFFMRGFGVINDTQMSFGLSKFFNLNENEDWMLSDDTDVSDAGIYEKFDGTLIIPFEVDGEIYFRTKMDTNNLFTDLANKILEKNPDLKTFILDNIARGKTPLFELISPLNRIVVEYKNTELKHICFVDNENGNVYPTFNNISNTFNTILDIKNELKNKENFEGYILYKKNKIYKIKSPLYVDMHRAISEVMNYKSCFNLILDEKIDDIKSLINDEAIDFIKNMETSIITKINHLFKIISNADRSLGRKDFVEKYRENIDNIGFAVLMQYYDGKIDDVVAALKNKMKQILNSEKRIKEYLSI